MTQLSPSENYAVVFGLHIRSTRTALSARYDILIGATVDNGPALVQTTNRNDGNECALAVGHLVGVVVAIRLVGLVEGLEIEVAGANVDNFFPTGSWNGT